MKSFDTEVQGKIKETLMNYKKLIKLSLKNNLFFWAIWKKMSLKERVNFARALVCMEQVAKNPKKYLSEAETCEPWLNSVQRYADENTVSIEESFEDVPCPCDIVYKKCNDVLKRTSYRSDYFDFLVAVQNYEYSNNVEQKSFEARCIIDESARVKKLIAKEKEDRWFNALLVMTGFNNIQK